MTRPVARPLEPHERVIAQQALLHHDVAPLELCERAIERCIFEPLDPSAWNVRGPRSLVAFIALRGSASGITLGRRVYIQRSLFGPRGELDLELAEPDPPTVVQYLRDGTVGFLSRYLREYRRNLKSGMSEYEAYVSISYEEEAFRVGRSAHTFA